MNFEYVDPRLVAIYNEYLKNDKEEEFINMLYALLDSVDPELRQKVSRARAAWKRKMKAPERKAAKSRVEAFFAAMSPEELIEFQNKPWEDIPDWLKEALPKLVQHPEECNFVRIYELVSKPQRQHEISASRLVRYMEKKRMITSDENGTHLHYDRFSQICNEKAEEYDLPWTPAKKAQKVRITPRDLKNYTQCRVTPKGDKMAILAKTTGLPLWYLGGYLNPAIPDIKPDNPLDPAPMPAEKYRKPRGKRA